MSNSSLITYKLLSPNHSGKRTMPIDRITPHCVVGQLTAAGICGCFTNSSVQASCNYGIGKDGDMGLCVDEGNRSWCTSSNANDQRAVTIECASDSTHPYAFTDKCYQSLIKLCVDICKRNGKKKLLWFGDKNKTLNYSPKSDEMILTVHRWFANKECPGDWMYSRMGDLANKVTTQLSGSMGDISSSTTYYRVRKSWNDPDSQLGAYEVLQNAKDNCPVGYSVFDEKGKAVYTNKETSATTSANTDKIWMGWTKRETGSAGLRCIFGDAGKAYGLQFDYRYGLVPFMQYCVNYNADRYSGFKPYINLGAGNSALIRNQGLGTLWQKYYDLYTNEFEQLQYTCAYQQYYLPSRNYILSHYGFDIGNNDPSVKGTLWSMSFRSGTETAAKKFASCKGKSDEAILNTVYPTYGSNDAGRWTKAGQWGDALNALKNHTYSLVNVSMTSSSTPSQTNPNTTSKTPYRVATSYSGGKYVGQVGAYDSLDNAKEMANETSQSAQKAYYVYDNTGAIIYTAKPSQTGKITKVSEWINVLKQWEQKMIDVKAVYNNSGNKTDYTVALKQSPVTTNCALFVTHALQVAGLFEKTDKFYGASDGSLKGTGAAKLTKNIGKIVYDYADKKMKTDKLVLIPGDIVTYYGQHTNVYLGVDSSGKKLWCDAGRGTNIGCKTGSSWKSFRRTGEISGMYVSKVIRLNLTNDVSKKTDTSKPATSTFEKYSVRVTISDLRIRETPNGTIKGYIKPGVYTIIGEKIVDGVKWGELLSGEGWIALQYTTKC